MPLTQSRYEGSKVMSALDPTQGPKVSQVSLPCDSQGSIDFSNYPFRVSIFDACHSIKCPLYHYISQESRTTLISFEHSYFDSLPYGIKILELGPETFETFTSV